MRGKLLMTSSGFPQRSGGRLSDEHDDTCMGVEVAGERAAQESVRYGWNHQDQNDRDDLNCDGVEAPASGFEHVLLRDGRGGELDEAEHRKPKRQLHGVDGQVRHDSRKDWVYPGRQREEKKEESPKDLL